MRDRMIDRRKLFKTATAASVFGVGLVGNTSASPIAPAAPVVLFRAKPKPLPLSEPEIRKAKLLNLHTGESTSVVYKENGTIIHDALSEVNNVLRDFRNGEVMQMDVALLDMLDELSRRLEVNIPYNVISAYRSPATNAMLAARSDGVARGSLHMQGKAIDIRVPGIALSHVRNAAKDLQKGGVGFYPGSDFVHLDTGRIRYW